MKKLIYILFLSFFIVPVVVQAEEEDGDFFDNLIVDESMKKEAEQIIEKSEGQMKASEILNKKPISLKMNEELKIKKEKVKEEELTPVVREPAPFGLKWLATKDEILYLKVKLIPTHVKDSPNSYMATNLPKSVKAFREVLLSFGETDSLWRIAAYGQFLEDDDNASKGVAEYKKYYQMLDEKYGNGEEFYTPAVLNVEETTTSEDGTVSKVVKQKMIEIGGEGFKEKLMNGESILYATFNNDHIGVTLALLVDGKGQTYVIIDYKNLKLNDIENEEIFDAL